MKLSWKNISIIIGIMITSFLGWYQVKKAITENDNENIKKEILIKELAHKERKLVTLDCFSRHKYLDKQVEQIQLEISRLKTLTNESRLKRIECYFNMNFCEELLYKCDVALSQAVNNVCSSFLEQEQRLPTSYKYKRVEELDEETLGSGCAESLRNKDNFLQVLRRDLNAFSTFKFKTSISLCRSRITECKEKVINCTENLNSSCPDLKISIADLFEDIKYDMTSL